MNIKRLGVSAIALLILICTAIIAVAETKYVVEEFEITMRTGPGTSNKIIALIPSGKQVEVITPGEEWTEVRLGTGKQGWVLTRYLTEELPSELRLERLQRKYEELLNRHKDLDQNATELGSVKKELTATLTDTQNKLTELTAAYEALKSESADFIQLKKNYQTTAKDLNEARTRAENAESELNRLSNNQIYTGMLYGGGLLAVGFIVGFIMKKPKRRSPLM